MGTRCARCGASMNCEPAGDCWCKELPHGPMPKVDVSALIPQHSQVQQPRQAGAQHAAPLEELTATGCLCRGCLQQDLRAQGLLDEKLERAGTSHGDGYCMCHAPFFVAFLAGVYSYKGAAARAKWRRTNGRRRRRKSAFSVVHSKAKPRMVVHK